MSIGTIDRTPPPFFRQGPSALTKLIVCSALALFLMVADNRFTITQQLRAVVATVLYYPQQALLVPVQGVEGGSDYFVGLKNAVAGEEAAKKALAMQSERALRVEQLLGENARLRGLLELRPNLKVHSQSAEVLYEASDPYSRKVVIDRGATNGIVLASPVINENGVLGQVTRVYPLSSEVTLLTDKDAAIPVLNTRTQARSAAFGSASVIGGGMEMRFMAGNADVQPNDVLTTSGVDGVYPPGLAVAKVTTVDRKVDSGFARIVLVPSAQPDGVRHVLVLDPVGLQMPARPEPVAPPDAKASAAKAATSKAAAAAGKASEAKAAAARAAGAKASEPKASEPKASEPKKGASRP
jgi:rod shape-determining protein MreC